MIAGDGDIAPLRQDLRQRLGMAIILIFCPANHGDGQIPTAQNRFIGAGKAIEQQIERNRVSPACFQKCLRHPFGRSLFMGAKIGQHMAEIARPPIRCG